MSRRRFGSVLGVAAVLAACGGDGSPSRAETVGAMTDVEVPSQWAAFESAAAELVGLADGLCAGTEVDDVSAAVSDTRAAWSELNPWWFGPVMDRRSRFVVEVDVVPDEIDDLIASDDALDPGSMRDLYGADQRGLGAIDHVLAGFDAAEPDPRSCQFVASNAELVRIEADELARAWQAFGPEQSNDDEAASSAIEAMVNESLFALSALDDESDPVVVDATLRGIEWAMVGDGTEAATGIAELLDDDVVELLASDLDAARREPTMERFEAVEVTITTNVVSALGLSIQFSDADGDG